MIYAILSFLSVFLFVYLGLVFLKAVDDIIKDVRADKKRGGGD